MIKEIVFSTKKRKELVNITSDIQEIVADSNIKTGICLVFIPHATAAILINEDERGLKEDIEKLLDSWIPEINWQHNQIDNNAGAHLASAFIGQSRIIPINNGQLLLGNWQEIFLAELDGPRTSRKVNIVCISDKN